MKLGILICLAGGLALSAVSRADDSINPNTSDLMRKKIMADKILQMKERHHRMKPNGSLAPGSTLNIAPSAGVPANNVNSTPAATSDAGNPYATIVTRNVFGLNPVPVVDPNAQPPGPPPPKITLTGITTIFGPAEALFKVDGVVRDGRPPQDESYIFTEGESQDDVEVTSIDTKKNVVTFNNHGLVQVLPLTDGTASTGSSPSMPSWPGGPRRWGRPFKRPNMGGPADYQPSSYVNPYGNGQSSAQPSGNNYGSSSGGYGNNGYGNNVQNLSANISPAISQLSAEDQEALVAAQHAQMEQDHNPLAPIMPPTRFDGEAGVGGPVDNAGGDPGGNANPTQ